VVAFVHALRDAGVEPRLPVPRRALERLSASPRRRRSSYGARRLELLLPA
jgi:hypothetical protein